jgi:hypothetical protein
MNQRNKLVRTQIKREIKIVYIKFQLIIIQRIFMRLLLILYNNKKVSYFIEARLRIFLERR